MKLKFTSKNKFYLWLMGIEYSGLKSLFLIFFTGAQIPYLESDSIHKPGSQYLTYICVAVTVLCTIYHLYKVFSIILISKNCKLIKCNLHTHKRYKRNHTNLEKYSFRCKYQFTIDNIDYTSEKISSKLHSAEWVVYEIDDPKWNFILSTIPSVSVSEIHKLNNLN
ncbi:hypothetical protein [Vallitalea okinawensis]|uniref:hypothetical protein n=1 Tax=Vallitalea okinawensis TaxID=2078660 RepID=UPI000CFE2436|nr:hypothetical protein [Vallitalea okinawensis]